MSEVTIKNIDELILNSKNYTKNEILLNKLSNLIMLYINVTVLNNNYNDLFNRELSPNDKRFISFCLLRIYSINQDLFTIGPIKHQMFKFIKESTPDVFSFLKIEDKTEGYKTEALLSNYTKDIENKIKENISLEFNLKSINKFKNTFLSSINHKNHKALIESFLDNSINKSLDKVFYSLNEYSECPNIEKYKNYNNAISLLDKLLEKASIIDTKYSREYITIPFNNIKTQLLEDFSDNPDSKPADLIVSKTEKKYPIKKGIQNRLQLKIENLNTGFANETKLKINKVNNIKLLEDNRFLGQVKTFSLVSLEYIGIEDSVHILISGNITWKNFDGENCKKEFNIQLDAQNSDIDWESISTSEPYDLEPVTNAQEFIGRSKIISDLSKFGKKITSSYIFGQRRVGKTSIVKTLKSINQNKNLLIIYLDAGDWNNATSPQTSMNDLGKKICKKIINYNIKLKNINIPDFNGSLNTITDFLDDVTDIDNELRVLIILDEFDRISNDLLSQGNIAQSFVLTIRSISNRDQYGFILVGGEKLEYILSQWQEFNKFKPIRVDYFDKKLEWDDFKNLIRLPVKNLLEISDPAIEFIYNQTSGNPYFTKKICIELFALMVGNRDSHVTENEAKIATKNARDSSNIAATDFSHFWKDGIKEKEEKEEQISINRRKVLLSLGQLIEMNVNTTKESIIDKSISNGLNLLEAEKTLDEFIQRRIIKIQNNNYNFVVKFFEDWLITSGLNSIITTFQEEEKIILRQRYEEEIKVKHNEINILSQKWSIYKGKQINVTEIRSWLEQFDGFENQRLIFKILENIKFYSQLEIRELMDDLFVEVRKEIAKSKKIVFKEEGKRKRDDILVSYLDNSPAKSGPEYNKIFVEHNNIYKDKSVNPDKLHSKLIELKNINALVFIDDFIGSGNSIIENLEPILLENKKIIKENDLIIIIGIITGFEEAKHKIIDFAKKQDITIILKLLKPLNDSDKCFSSTSLVFEKNIEREKAKEICEKIGVKLEKKHPLGYNDCQATVIFPNTCPNNTLPIFWKETTEWKPLFKRG